MISVSTVSAVCLSSKRECSFCIILAGVQYIVLPCISWSAYLSGIVGCCVMHVEPVGTMSESGFIGWISVVIRGEYHGLGMVGA